MTNMIQQNPMYGCIQAAYMLNLIANLDTETAVMAKSSSFNRWNTMQVNVFDDFHM